MNTRSLLCSLFECYVTLAHKQKVYSEYLYDNTLLDGFVTQWFCDFVCPFAIETTFPFSNLKTKHIFGILTTLWKFIKLRGAAGAPNFFIFFHFFPIFFLIYILLLPPPKTAPNGRRRCPKRGTKGALHAAPEAPFPRTAREIPPKAVVSRVLYREIFVSFSICL